MDNATIIVTVKNHIIEDVVSECFCSDLTIDFVHPLYEKKYRIFTNESGEN